MGVVFFYEREYKILDFKVIFTGNTNVDDNRIEDDFL